MPFDTLKAIEDAREELRQRMQERAWIENRIADLNLTLRSLARTIEDEGEKEKLLAELAQIRRKPAGLTETILECLSKSPHHAHSAVEIRDWLEREGFDLSDYSQPLSTISITLGRIAKSGRAKIERDRRKVAYRWQEAKLERQNQKRLSGRYTSRFEK
jgi:hypothetical protein